MSATSRELVAALSGASPKLTEAPKPAVRGLKAGLATLTVFVNNTNRLIAEHTSCRIATSDGECGCDEVRAA